MAEAEVRVLASDPVSVRDELARYLAVVYGVGPTQCQLIADQALAFAAGMALANEGRAGLPHPWTVAARGRDVFAITPERWAQMDLRDRLLAEGEAAETIKRALPQLLDAETRGRAEYVVACGRTDDGSPRVVYAGPARGDAELIGEAEHTFGLKAWRLATVEPAPAEESGPAGSGVSWASGVGRWLAGAPGVRAWSESDDRYPMVRLRVTLTGPSPARSPAVEFLADLDTGCPYCCLSLEALLEALGPEVVAETVDALGEQHHLGQAWLCWRVRRGALQFHVETRDGWASFEPRESDMLATVAWDADHALSQVRRDRRAIAGRCIWRGKVKLALESSDADWESAPPVTY